MTSIPLHSMPRWRSVAAEQIRAVGLMARKAGMALVALLVVLLVVVVRASVRERGLDKLHIRSGMLEIAVAPWAAIGALVAALFAIAMWRDEDPDRRSYHWMMPVEPHVHAVTKVLAGWLWLLAATVVSLVSIVAIGALSSTITGLPWPSEIVSVWFWIVPITSVTVAYLLTSAAAVGTRQPLIWVVGIIFLYAGLLLALDVLGYRDTHHVVRTALIGEYGFTAALAGDVDHLDTATLRMTPSIGRWFSAFAVWGGLGALLLVATAYRRAEPAVIGAHGPFRRAIFGHAWLVASVVALSVAAGVVATRVMKPEYEAKATIWSMTEAKSLVVTSADTRVARAGEALELLASLRIADTVVRQLALYVRPDNAADTSLLNGFSIAERFLPGDYRIAFTDSATRWLLSMENVWISDSGAVGDSIGRTMGLRWRPEAATLAKYAGREVRFTLATPRESARELLSRMTIAQQGNSSFVRMALTDPDPRRAARALNAVGSAYVSRVRSPTGAALSFLDTAVTPRTPFKNSALQLFVVSLVIGIAAAIGLAFAASAFEHRIAFNETE